MKKKLLALFLALVMVGAVLPGCGDGSKDPGGQGNNGKTGEPVKGGEITVGIAQDLDDSLDPHQTVAAGTREVLFNIFEGLVKPNSDGEMIPAVAEKYELSEDGTTYTFTLREGVKFHNGQTVTAEDVVYSINRCAAVPEGQEKPLVAAFSAVKSVEALDEKTVAVTIAQRDLEFISYMTAAIIPADYENQDTAPVGTGPFKFVSRTPQQDFVMERFEDYWGTPAWLDKVTYKICENADALVMNLNGGSIDLCAHLTSAQASQLNQSFQVLEGTMNLVQALYLNNAVEPFNNEKVRQALCYAVDVDAMMDAMHNYNGASTTACPSPEEWAEYFLQADNVFAFTISSNLSGSYNAAMAAREMVLEEHPEKQICVIDSRAAAGAMVLPDGRVVTGKNSSLLGPSAALLLNAIKALAGIDKELDLLPSSIIAPISDMKISHLGHRNPRLHSDEVLIALSISAVTNPLAELVLKKLDELRGCDAHFSVILSEEDTKLYNRLGIHVSCEPKYEIKKLYHK